MATGVNLRLLAGKAAYTQAEAARALGVSLTQFRTLLVRCLLAPGHPDLQLTRFRPSDLLVLRRLAQTVR